MEQSHNDGNIFKGIIQDSEPHLGSLMLKSIRLKHKRFGFQYFGAAYTSPSQNPAATGKLFKAAIPTGSPDRK